MNSVDKKIKIDQIKYLIKLKYKIYVFQKTNFLTLKNSKSTNIDLIFLSKKNNPQIKNFDLIREIEIESECFEHISYQPIMVDGENDNKDFFLTLLFTNPNLGKLVLNNHQIFIYNFKLDKYYKEILTDNKFNTFKEFNDFFTKTFTKTFWSVNKIDLHDMHNIIQKKWGDELTFKFWFNFLKIRRNQINDPKNSKRIYDFLVSIYHNKHQKLLKISSFFKYLRAKFEEPIIDIFEENTQYSINFSLNLKKMINSFFIDNFLSEHYLKSIEKLSLCLVEYHNFDYYKIHKKYRQIVSINFYHNQESIKDSEIKKTIIDFFLHLKHEHKKELEHNQIMKWLNYYYLNQKISNKNNNIKENIKI